jgi:hypothetical protein
MERGVRVLTELRIHEISAVRFAEMSCSNVSMHSAQVSGCMTARVIPAS